MAILIFFILFSSCQKQESDGIEPVKVKGTAAYLKAVPDNVSGFGNLTYLAKFDITSTQDAVIKKLFFREGDYVKEGELTVILENPQIQLAVERSENNFSQAQSSCELAKSRLLEGIFQAEAQLLALDKADTELRLARRKWDEDNRKHKNQEILFEAGGINTETILSSRFMLESELQQINLMERELEIRKIGSRDLDLARAGIMVPVDENEKKEALIQLITNGLSAEYDAARSRLEAAEKELISVKIALSELNIYSPSDGIIGVRYFEEGERIKSQDKLFSLIDIKSLYAVFPLREKDAVRIEQGMKAKVHIDATGELFDGSVDLIYPQADSQNLSFIIRVLLNEDEINQTNPLKPGMFIRSTITLGPDKEIICIPESAIFNQKSGEGNVFIINGTSLVERKITFGLSFGEEREVKEGLKLKDIVVLNPDTGMREGTYVSLID